MNAIFGLLLVAGSVLGGFAAMGGNLWVLWQPWEMVMIIGASVGAYIIANPNSVIRETFKAIGGLVKGRPHSKEEYLELFSLLYMIIRMGKDNLAKLEKDLDQPETSKFFNSFSYTSKNTRNVRFIADYFRLILLGSEKSHELESLIDTEIETIEQDLNRVPNALMIMADSLPAVGIVAAVLGVIKAMGAIAQPPEILGALIGGALVGTFLGILLSYGLVGPLAAAVRARREQELAYYIAIKASIISFLNGYRPQICIEYARKTIAEEVRPVFEEVESTMQSTADKLGMKV